MRRLRGLVAVLATTLFPGCIVLTGEFYDPVPDPLADRFVTGTVVQGRTITLADGRQFQLAGVDVQQMDAEQQKAFEAGLAKLVVGGQKLLILNEKEAVVPIACSAEPRLPWERFPAIVLFPVHVKVPPQRIDVGLQLVGLGLAHVRESEIPDPKQLAAYRQAAENAKQHRIGVWRTEREYLCDAAAEGNLDKVKAMVEAGVSVNGVGYTHERATTPLSAAAGHGRDEVVHFLIGRSAELGARCPVDALSYNKRTALTAAVAAGHAKVVSLLIAAGADVNLRGGSSPLETAVSHGHVEIVRLLLDSGAKTGPSSDGDSTALYLAANQGNMEIVKLLVEHGAKVNEADSEGRTPLWTAAANGYGSVVEYLLSQGADVNARSKDGYTPLKHARRMYYPEIVQFLEKAGGHE